MTKSQFPFITLLLVTVSSGLMQLNSDWQALLYFNRETIETGNLYNLISGHVIHSNASHWLWNNLALLILGTIIERQSRKLLLCNLVAGIIAVDLLLLSPLSHIQYYCGLSGILNTLLITGLWLIWIDTQSKWVIVSALLCIAKIIIEICIKEALLTNISWPPYPAAHLAGAIAGGILVFTLNIGGQLKLAKF